MFTIVALAPYLMKEILYIFIKTCFATLIISDFNGWFSGVLPEKLELIFGSQNRKNYV